jgi:HEAT repeat protein
VFYFLKNDPAFGESELRRNLSTAVAQPNCYNMQSRFRDLGRYAWSEALERLMIEYLSSPNMGIKNGAAWALGEYGSSAAEPPLRNALAGLRSHWKGNEQQPSNPSQHGSLRKRIRSGNGATWAQPRMEDPGRRSRSHAGAVQHQVLQG